MPETIDRSKIPSPSQPRPFYFPEFERQKINDCVEVITVTRNHLPLVNVLLFADFSPLEEKDGQEGQMNLLSHLLLEGTSRLNSQQIATQFEGLGAHYNTHLSWTGFFFELNILRDNLQDGFLLMSHLVKDSIFPEDQFLRLKQEALIERLQILDMPGRLANERLLKSLFTNHRYGLPIEGLKETIEQASREDIVQLYRQLLPNRKLTFIFTGNIDSSQAVELTRKVFSTSQSCKPGAKPSSFSSAPLQKIMLVHKPNAAQCEVRLGQFIPERNHSDFFKIKLLNEIFGGYFLSRLNLNLREKHGFTYGIHSHLVYRPGVGLMMISSSIQNDFVAPALQEIFGEIDRLRAHGVTQKELENAAGYMIGAFPNAFETIDQISDAIANIITFNLPDDYYRTFRDRIAQVTKNDVLEAAQRYLKKEDMHIVLVGDRHKLEKQLKNHFAVQIVDLNGNTIT